jgi:hypothetical protein
VTTPVDPVWRSMDGSSGTETTTTAPPITAATLAIGGNMSRDAQPVHPGSEIDLAIDRALEAAKLHAGDAAATSIAFVEHSELSAVEVDGGAADGD